MSFSWICKLCCGEGNCKYIKYHYYRILIQNWWKIVNLFMCEYKYVTWLFRWMVTWVTLRFRYYSYHYLHDLHHVVDNMYQLSCISLVDKYIKHTKNIWLPKHSKCCFDHWEIRTEIHTSLRAPAVRRKIFRPDINSVKTPHSGPGGERPF